MYEQSASCVVGFKAEPKGTFKIRNHSVTAVTGLIVSDENLNFSCSQPQTLPQQVLCSIVFASTGHCVLLKFGLQDCDLCGA